MRKERTIEVRVYRSPSRDAEDGCREGQYVEYEVPYEEQMTVLRVLNYIAGKYDRSLAFYYSCRIGKCLGCFVDIDGKTRLACTTLAKNGMTIGPSKRHNLIRDLVVDYKREA